VKPPASTLIKGGKMSDLTIVIPAAGSSSRMRGADKLLSAIDGVPLLRRTALVALASHPIVVITLRVDDTARQQVVQDLPVQIVTVPDAAMGLSASLRRAAAQGQGRLMILPADMPDLTTQDLALMIHTSNTTPDALLRATAQDGTLGHPVVFPDDLRPAFATLSGDQGARPLLQANAHRLQTIALPALHALTDLDTPEAWQAWIQSRTDV
jgi:CTP:molybdopterin cytidylyltransferase MocA